MGIVAALLMTLQAVGKEAPKMALPNQDGKEIKLADFKGKKNVLVAFYPKDFTGGWTKELKQLRDSIKTYQAKDVVILGVSADPVDSHKKFCDSLKLPFDLLADVDMKGHKAWGFKKRVRATFLVDKKGVVRFAAPKFSLSKEGWNGLAKAVAALEDPK